ncbi:uncharacterized protein LOC135396200 [Ornithodoros turicata]|uniref:uncharacterized protein LOC135396200 n=1 Tax=Ornithodoros turicata TaxID=34597 RepID=UPI003139ECC1
MRKAQEPSGEAQERRDIISEENEEETESTSTTSRTPYYKPLLLPSGKIVDITKRNQFIREWKKEHLRCDVKPYMVLLVSFSFLFLVMYAYTYHQAVIYTILEKFQGKTTSSIEPRNLNETSEYVTVPFNMAKGYDAQDTLPARESPTTTSDNFTTNRRRGTALRRR